MREFSKTYSAMKFNEAITKMNNHEPETTKENNSNYFSFNKNYLICERVVGCKLFEDKILKFFVKWKDLNYDCCTWEYPELLQKLDPNLLKNFFTLNDLRNKLCNKLYCQNFASRLTSKPKTPFTDITKTPKYNISKNSLCTFPYLKPQKLNPHQLSDLNWLAYSWHIQNNVIVEDETGLGNPYKILPFFAYLISKGIDRPFLVVAPLTTSGNWEREIQRWLPGINLV